MKSPAVMTLLGLVLLTRVLGSVEASNMSELSGECDSGKRVESDSGLSLLQVKVEARNGSTIAQIAKSVIHKGQRGPREVCDPDTISWNSAEGKKFRRNADGFSVGTMPVVACKTAVVGEPGCHQPPVIAWNTNNEACYCAIEADVETRDKGTWELYTSDVQAGTCRLYGDPHITGFDQPLVSPDELRSLLQVDGMMDAFAPGDHWLVKSELVQVQGRFAHVYYPKARYPKHQVYLTALAVGGPFLQGHTLVIEPRYGRVMWNRHEILDSLPSQFEDVSKNGTLIEAKYNKHTPFVNDAKQHTTGVTVKLPSHVKMTVNRFGDHLGLILAMPRSAGGQHGMDGYCGNFNCDANDDAAALIQKRMDLRVAKDDLLF